LKIWINLFIAVLCYFYPLSAAITTILNLPSSTINGSIRFILFLLSFIFLTYKIFNKRILVIPQRFWLVLIFWFFYSFRILIDLYLFEIRFSDNDNIRVVGFSFGNILFPMIMLIINVESINYKFLSKYIYYLLCIANLLIVFTVIFLYQNISNVLLTRATISNDVNNDVLNPILISYLGALLFSTTLCILFFKLKSRNKAIYMFFLLVGLLNIIFGASRGPVVLVIVNIFIILLIKIKKNIKNLFFGLIIIFFVTILIYFLLPYFLNILNINLDEIAIINRFTEYSEESEERIIQYSVAWNDFLDSPIIGKQFVSTYKNFYPHNIILELLMATGILGFSLYMAFAYKALSVLRYFSSNSFYHYILIYLCYVSAFVSNLFSGNLFQSIETWILLVVCIELNYRFTNSRLFEE
jgi:hypothetical protein